MPIVNETVDASDHLITRAHQLVSDINGKASFSVSACRGYSSRTTHASAWQLDQSWFACAIQQKTGGARSGAVSEVDQEMNVTSRRDQAGNTVNLMLKRIRFKSVDISERYIVMCTRKTLADASALHVARWSVASPPLLSSS